MQVEYRYLNALEAEDLAERGAVPLIPLGSLEQHCRGPLGLDGLIAERLSVEACRRSWEAGVPCTVLPTLYYGFSPEWSRIPGTVSLGLESYAGLVRGIIRSLHAMGFRGILLVNGHGGNTGLLYSVAREAVSSLGLVIGVAEYWRLLGVGLGHASSVEEYISRRLGLEVELGGCREDPGVLDPVIVRPGPGDPVVVESRGRVEGDPVEAVARLIASIYNEARRLARSP